MSSACRSVVRSTTCLRTDLLSTRATPEASAACPHVCASRCGPSTPLRTTSCTLFLIQPFCCGGGFSRTCYRLCSMCCFFVLGPNRKNFAYMHKIFSYFFLPFFSWKSSLVYDPFRVHFNNMNSNEIECITSDVIANIITYVLIYMQPFILWLLFFFLRSSVERFFCPTLS